MTLMACIFFKFPDKKLFLRLRWKNEMFQNCIAPLFFQCTLNVTECQCKNCITYPEAYLEPS